ncbi:MAG TPA: hypothetical protein VL069_15740 [Opitutus sp.]|nr:hypothetical protein [Opitutus sp.]
MPRLRSLLSLVTIAVAFTGCAKKSSDETAHAEHAHHHASPHGGTAVVLGDEVYQLEFVLDEPTGTMTAYVLDGHMEKFIRINVLSFEVVATVDAERRPLIFQATANEATGEIVGDTSQFTAQADWLKTTAVFDAQITELTIRGRSFSEVTFNFPAGNHQH